MPIDRQTKSTAAALFKSELLFIYIYLIKLNKKQKTDKLVILEYSPIPMYYVTKRILELIHINLFIFISKYSAIPGDKCTQFPPLYENI